MTAPNGGPVKRTNTVTEQIDGKWVHTFRQSWLGEYMTCQERARRDAFEPAPRTENDAAGVGTVMHATIEDCIDAMMVADHYTNADEAVEIFDGRWDRFITDNDVQWVKRKARGAQAYGRRMVTTFARDVLPSLHPHAIEVPFGPLVLSDTPERVIRITGTIDYVDATLGLVDWKSAGRPYEPWEKERWAIQPTVYDAAWRIIGPTHRNQWTDEPYRGPYGEWRYVVFPDTKRQPLQVVPLKRTVGHGEWLLAQLTDIAVQLERTLEGDTWTRNDQHALCSAKWCPYWDTCKGLYVSPDEGKL